jgi:hypothetical protein
VEVLIGPEWKDVMENWRKLHNEELYDSHPSQNIIWMIETKGIKWEGNVPHMGEGFGRKT